MITYILIGIVFMFFIEWGTHTDVFKKHMVLKNQDLNNHIIGWMERILGILFWPICFGVFLYFFIKQYFK